jgi:hypothetical protein
MWLGVHLEALKTSTKALTFFAEILKKWCTWPFSTFAFGDKKNRPRTNLLKSLGPGPNESGIHKTVLVTVLYTCGRERHKLGPNKEEMINRDSEAEQTDLCPRSILGVEFFFTVLFFIKQDTYFAYVHNTIDG